MKPSFAQRNAHAEHWGRNSNSFFFGSAYFPYIIKHISSENQITYRVMWSMVCTIYPTFAISSVPNNVQRNVENSLCYVPCFSPELCFICNMLSRFTGCYVQYMCRGGGGWEKWLRPPQIGSKVCSSAPPKVYIRQIFSLPCCNEARALHQKILKQLDLKKWKLCLVQ